MDSNIISPRQELAQLIEKVKSRGMRQDELSKIESLGSDGYGVQAQLESLYYWLEARQAGKPAVVADPANSRAS